MKSGGPPGSLSQPTSRLIRTAIIRPYDNSAPRTPKCSLTDISHLTFARFHRRGSAEWTTVSECQFNGVDHLEWSIAGLKLGLAANDLDDVG